MGLYEEIDDSLSLEKIKEIVTMYCSEGNFYHSLTHNCPSKVKGKYSIYYKDKMDVFLFEKWKNSLIHLMLTNRIRKEYLPAVKKLILYLKDKEPTSSNEVMDIMYGDKIQDEDCKKALDLLRWNRLGEFSSWIHVDSSYVLNGTHKREDILHRLYLNCDSTYSHEILYEFLKKCHEKHIRYYFKFDEYGSRDDTIVFYSDTKHLLIYANLIQEIISQKQLSSHIHNPPLLTGKIYKTIGYGSEPLELANGERTSFNEKRQYHLTSCIENLSLEWMMKNKNRKVLLSTQEIPYQTYLCRSLVQKKRASILQYMKDGEDHFQRGYTKDEVVSSNFIKEVTQYILCHIEEVFNAIKLHSSITVPFRRGFITFSSWDLNDLLKEQTKLITKVYPSYYSDLKTKIRNSCIPYDIDSDHYSIDFSKVSLIKGLDVVSSMEKSYQKIKK